MNLLASERFEVSIEGTHGIHIPEAIAIPFAEKGHKRVKLKVFFNESEITFHGALHKYLGRYVISFGKRYQKELGIYPSDYFDLQLFEDTSKYGVEMPEEFSAVLESDPEAQELFELLTDGARRSLIYYVLQYKNSQTRIDKALLISENIKRGIKKPREIVKK